MNSINRTIVGILFLLVALGLALVLIWPKYQNLGGLKTDIKEKNAEWQSKSEYFSKIKEISVKLEDYQEELSKISSALPSSLSLPVLFSFLQQTSAQAGLVLEQITLAGIVTVKNDSKKEINIALELAGSYPSLKSFLLALEKSARLIEVENISFSAPEDLSDPISFRITIKTHSY